MPYFCMLLFWGLALCVSILPAGMLRAAGEQPVDLELILAVDTSSSVSAEEFDLQMRGLSQAFRNPVVAGAIRATGDLGIAVALVQWADNRKQFLAIDWLVIKDETDAAAFADEIDNTPRFLIGGGTAIGALIEYGMNLLSRNAFHGKRKVIDISGDGRTNQGSYPTNYRERAVVEGVTVNGLAILNEDPNVDRYYRSQVIAGTGAFVMSATTYEDFSAAMLEKLLKEIAGTPIVQAPHRDLPEKSLGALALNR